MQPRAALRLVSGEESRTALVGLASKATCSHPRSRTSAFVLGAAPAIEFNVFPYEQYATRQLRHRLRRRRRAQPLQRRDAVRVAARNTAAAPVRGDARSAAALGHDAGRRGVVPVPPRSLEDTGWRSRASCPSASSRGLSVEIEGSASRIRDQLSLPRRGADPEEILLRLRELQSGYEVSLSVGFSYSFGSIFNNIVNPRGSAAGVGVEVGGGGGGGWEQQLTQSPFDLRRVLLLSCDDLQDRTSFRVRVWSPTLN